MTRVRITGGFLNIAQRDGGHPDNELPEGEGPVDPGFGVGRPPSGSTLPEPPPGIWPPPSWNHPWRPLPPDSTTPPGTIWPSVGIDNTLPGGPPVHIGGGPAPTPPPAGTKPPPPTAGHPLPPMEKGWLLVWISDGIGWKYISVDPNLRPGHDLPPTPEPKKA
jgi:hypothetical protein